MVLSVQCVEMFHRKFQVKLSEYRNKLFENYMHCVKWCYKFVDIGANLKIILDIKGDHLNGLLFETLKECPSWYPIVYLCFCMCRCLHGCIYCHLYTPQCF